MGGTGSGRTCGKAVTDDCRSLDVRQLQRDGPLVPGECFAWNWIRGGKTVASINVRTESDKVILDYQHRSGKGDWQSMIYPVRLDWTYCTYGGRRAWFLCPAQGCGRRVAILYIGNAGIFACRHCYQLAYRSQRETPDDRALRRADKVRKQLGWGPGIARPKGAKPMGMQWRTFERLNAAHDAFARAAFAGWRSGRG